MISISLRCMRWPALTRRRPPTQTSLTSSRPAEYTRVLTGENTGEVPGRVPNSTATRSASLPTSMLPISSSRWRARAPFNVAILRAIGAGIAVASLDTPFASRAASFISSNMSKLLFDPAESVPSATLTPAFTRSATRQKPLANFKLDDGQCVTLALRLASSLISSSSRCTICAASKRSLTKPRRSKFASGRAACSDMWHADEFLSSAAEAEHSSAVSCR
mmetsp:Transcript_3619/g.7926  ORF Transcript_3619/g.7926 Transcript_3619/m.7926 type:complete len:220 (+) Transcript_3619:1563-2222(+)